MTAGTHANPMRVAIAWREAGRRVAVATVVATWGSSPRPVGSMLVVDERGTFEGSVSGGCIEAEVVSEALDVLDSGGPRLLEYGVSDETAHAAGLSCGGQVTVQLRDLADPAALKRVLEQPPAVLVHGLRHDREAVVSATAASGTLDLDPAELETVRVALADDRSTVVTAAGDDAFALVVNPPLRLVVVGAVHIAQSLVPLAGMMGFEVTVLDPRPAFASTQRLPGVALTRAWPDKGLAALAPDGRTAVVSLTHDPVLDDPALAAALASPAFYIGALGSRRTHAKRLDRLRARGFDDHQLERVMGPVGLDIGARRPEEIALAITAELVAARYGKVPARRWPAPQ